MALDVIDGRDLQRRDAHSLSSVLNGSVAGIWAWEQSPTSLLARYASIRGASSFGLSYPKVCIDGIEVANSLLVTALDVESIDHVEVIRGPQGAALYGADAISGVINIVTRHDGVDGGAPRVELQTGAGMASSVYSLNDASTFGTPFTSAADSALRAARGSAVRGTARVSSVAQLGAANGVAGSATVALEHSAVREASRLPTVFGPEPPPEGYGATERTVTSRSNTGFIGQVNGSFREAVFLSAGVRFEHNAGTANVDRTSTLPMVGAAFVHDFGRAALKFRAAYGKGFARPRRRAARRRGWECAGPTAPRTCRRRSSRVSKLIGRVLGLGDRMLEVPERTLSATASYARGPWSASIMGSRAYDWVNYDRVALAAAVESNDRLPRDLIGPQLRSFWRVYPGVNRLRANVSYDVRRALSLIVTGDNLLDHQLGEPDNVTVLPGRTITGGLRASF